MKIAHIVNPQFNSAFSTLLSQPVPMVIGIKLREIHNAIRAKQLAYDESREALLKDLCEKDADGKPMFEDETKTAYKLSDEGRAKFSVELAKVFNEEFEMASVEAKDLGDKVSLTPQNLILLEDIVK
jgi:hypothetical protein